jgi:hypothetical protein
VIQGHCQIAAAFEDLAGWTEHTSAHRVELLAEAASMWSVAGYEANSDVLAEALLREIETDGQEPTIGSRLARLVAVLLKRDVRLARRTGLEAVDAIPALSETLMSTGDDRVPVDDVALLVSYGLVGRGAVKAVRFWQRRDDDAADRALSAIGQARQVLLSANIA